MITSILLKYSSTSNNKELVKIIYDYHIHSYHSPDSDESIRNTIESAINKGINGICFTDHIDIGYPNPPLEKQLSFCNYRDEILSLKDKYSEHIQVYIGIEMGLQLDYLEQSHDYLSDKSLDFVLGSIHCIKGQDLYLGDGLDKTQIDSYNDFFAEELETIKRYDNFDVLGHIDIVRRYGSFDSSLFDYSNHRYLIDDILKTIIDKGKGIEVNTSGVRYALQSFHPVDSIIKRYFELGGEIITLGSDSHRAPYVGYMLKEAKELLKSIGFSHYTIFIDRKPKWIKI